MEMVIIHKHSKDCFHRDSGLPSDVMTNSRKKIGGTGEPIPPKHEEGKGHRACPIALIAHYV